MDIELHLCVVLVFNCLMQQTLIMYPLLSPLQPVLLSLIGRDIPLQLDTAGL